MKAKIGSWWLASLEAMPGEKVLFSVLANRRQSSQRAVGGKLFITNLRVIFIPHLFDSATGGEQMTFPLQDLHEIGTQPSGGDFFGGGMRDRLRLVHRSGMELFVVNKLPVVIENIERLLRRDGTFHNGRS